MPGRSLDNLVAAGLLQAKPPDKRRVSRWLARSRKDLDLAANLLADVDRDRAMAVAYDPRLLRAAAGHVAVLPAPRRRRRSRLPWIIVIAVGIGLIAWLLQPGQVQALLAVLRL